MTPLCQSPRGKEHYPLPPTMTNRTIRSEGRRGQGPCLRVTGVMLPNDPSRLRFASRYYPCSTRWCRSRRAYASLRGPG